MHVTYFNPDVTSLIDEHRDFPLKIREFHAGEGYENFDDFISDEAIEFQENSDGVTYVVWNVQYDTNDDEVDRSIIAFYTLAVTAIPYEDRIRLDAEEAKLYKNEFDIKICGIPALEIKMFAVDERFQDVFYEFEGEDLPISAWIMRQIIDYANELIPEVAGFKAIFLHAVPSAEKFYCVNGFNTIKVNMHPLHGVDSEYKAMYLALMEVHMNYDE